MNVNTGRRYPHEWDPEQLARETDLDTGPRWLMPILSTWITGVFHSAGQTRSFVSHCFLPDLRQRVSSS